MSTFADNRLPYDDASSPREMYADCQAVGAHLHIPQPRTSPTGATPREHATTEWGVSDNAARFAAGFHLHLN